MLDSLYNTWLSVMAKFHRGISYLTRLVRVFMDNGKWCLSAPHLDCVATSVIYLYDPYIMIAIGCAGLVVLQHVHCSRHAVQVGCYIIRSLN